MKYHQIEAFYQVMLTGSISKAAKNLGRTQPAVSMTIATLEEFLATALFDRHAGRITPRAEAAVLFQQISPVMDQLNDIRHRFGRLAQIEVPRISIISSSNVGNHLVPTAIASFARKGQQMRLMTGNSAAIVSEMENQRHDIAISDEGTAEISMNSPLYEVQAFEIPVYAFFKRGLISTQKSEIVTKDLAGQDICMLYEENRATRQVRTKLGTPKIEFSTFFAMACFAVQNESVAIVDNITRGAMAALTGDALRGDSLLLKDIDPARYYLIRSRYRPRSKTADRCYETLRNALLNYQNKQQ
ncbi:LysR family transcriptional regulator [Brucella pseudogrignonensis]|uniref:LysR family transcriptional regulator n=1 Tax=Brucella pseudogrignonensis TaxID=419475 RepID=UPI0028B2D548|nr:LysR family transcriptional regulator [Brucella pseudogrignonensis]MDT6942543.1 LysR family transcriptional regulator [Brucella pseudogrignonensis]